MQPTNGGRGGYCRSSSDPIFSWYEGEDLNTGCVIVHVGSRRLIPKYARFTYGLLARIIL